MPDSPGDTREQCLKDMLTWILEPAKRLQRDAERALSSPDSAVDALQRHVHEGLDRELAHDPAFLENWLRRLIELVKDIDEVSILEALRRRRQTRHSQDGVERFWPVVQAAHARIPNSPLVLVWDPAGWGRAVLRGLGPLIRLADSPLEEEPLGRAALDAFMHAASNIYEPYLAKLKALEAFATGTVIRHVPVPGALCEQLSKNALVLDRVDGDAAHLRNAVAHENYRYLGADAWRVWEKARPGRTPWEARLSTADVVERAWSMCEHSQGLARALNEFMMDRYMEAFAPTLPRMAVAFASPNPAVLRDFSQEWEQRLDAMFGGIPAEAWHLRGVGEEPEFSKPPDP